MGRPKLDRPNFRLRPDPVSGIYLITWTENRKPRSLSTRTRDRREADTAFQQFLAGLDAPEPKAAITIDEIMDGYLADRRGRVASIATLEHSAKPIRRHVGALQPHHIRRKTYWDKRKADGVSDGTIIREGVTLRAGIAWARAEKLITADQVPSIDLPPKPPARSRWLTPAEGARLIEATRSHHMRLFVLIALQTGARAGAILSLTWDRVRFDHGVIEFDLPGRAVTNKRRAVVPLTDGLRAVLLEASEAAVTDHVIEYGGHKVSSVKKAFERAVERAGVEPCSPHTLRHTAATWMIMGGVPTARVARYLGDTEAMIEKVYGKHSPEYLRDAAGVLDALTNMQGSPKLTPPKGGENRGSDPENT